MDTRVVTVVLADEFGDLERQSTVVEGHGDAAGEAAMVAAVVLLRTVGALFPGDVLRVIEE